MRVPPRIRLLLAYLASMASPAADRGRPPLRELVRNLTQPGKRRRALRHVSDSGREPDGRFRVRLAAPFDRDVHYPAGLGLVDLLASIEMTFDPGHWHHYWQDAWRPGPGDLVIDCGVAEGLFTLDAARGGARVLGFEPTPLFREVLSGNLAGVDQATVIPKAAGAQPGMVRFALDGAGSSVSAEGIEVEISTIDREVDEAGGGRVSMIKADVEGFEYDVLLGAQEVIRRDAPRLAITVYHHENNVPQISGLLRRLHPGYRIHCRGIAPNGHPVMLHARCHD